MKSLITKEVITQFTDAYRNNEFTQADAEELHQILFWKDRNYPEFEQYLQQLEDAFKNFFAVKLERPVLRNYNDVHKKKTKEAFDLLFDKTSLFSEVEKIFSEIGKEELTIHEMYDYRSAHRNDLEKAFNNAAIELIRNFTVYGRILTLERVRTFFENEKVFYDYQINAIYENLHGSNGQLIEVSQTQLNFIQDWCLQTGDVPKILWFFIHRFTIQLEVPKLLDLTLYYDFNTEKKFSEPGTIEQLETFISRQSLKKKVVANLLNEIGDVWTWLSNAGYAFRHNIKEAYPAILTHLERVNENEFKYNEVLEFWFKKTSDAKRLAQFIKSVRSDVLRWQAIRLLSNSGKEQLFLSGYLKKIMNNVGESKRFAL